MEIEIVETKIESRCASKCGQFVDRHSLAIKCMQRTSRDAYGVPYTHHIDCFIESARLALWYAENLREKINRDTDSPSLHRHEEDGVSEHAARGESSHALAEKV